MSQPLDGDGLDEGIGENDLLAAECGGIAGEGRLDVGAQQIAQAGQGLAKFQQNRFGPRGRALGIVQTQALADLFLELLDRAGESVAGQNRQRVFMNRLLVMEARKKNLQEIDTDRRDGTLGRQVEPVRVVQSADTLIGSEDLLHDVI